MIDFKVDDGKLVIGVDPNEDGEAVVEVVVHITEIPDEVMDLLNKDDGTS